MLNPLDPYKRHFSSLSIKDLLDAREAYHVHLMQMHNVFASAIGLYRIRKDDLDYTQFHPTDDAVHRDRNKKATPRTMENTKVKAWSWPCVLVFVKDWLSPANLHDASLRSQLVPPFLYLPDGRVVPTCVIQASLWPGSDTRLIGYQFSQNTIGGGYPVYTEVQGREHVGSIACVVTDGARHFALTNQHVAGNAGSEVFALLQGDGRRIGYSANRSVRSVPFEKLYPGLPGATTRGNLDVGLIEIDNLADWSAQVYGLGVLGPVAEFNANTASLDWIGTPAVAHGAHSGDLQGEVKALFYRYRTMGGVDYVSDFLIGGVGEAPLTTQPGDSGTLWCIATPIPTSTTHNPRKRAGKQHVPLAKEAEFLYRPFAVEWGGQKLNGGAAGAQYTQYALASSVAIACRELDVEIVTDLNAELAQYWGAVGHYKIAERAVDATTTKLNAFLTANLAQLTYPASAINGGKIKPSATEFVPLADVPDVVWKSNINRTGVGVRPQENWNHYADMDFAGAGGQSLFDLCGVDTAAPTLTATTLKLTDWLTYYRSAPQPSNNTGKKSGLNMGDLPFRVWQIFDAMVAAESQDAFLCAAGILAHYVGDACQPLHSSVHADGLDGASTGVHSTYEELMVNKYASELAKKLDGKPKGLDPQAKSVKEITSGRQAGLAVIELMARAHRYLPPTDICKTYDDLGGGHKAAVLDGLWQAYDDATVRCIADGARTLGQLWQAAYNLNPAGDYSGEVSQETLQVMYEDASFLPSLHLANLDPKDFAET